MSQTCVGWLQTDLLTTTLYGVKGKCSWDDIWNNIVMALKQQKEYYDQKRTKQKEYFDQKLPNQWWVLHFLIDSDILPTLYKSSNLSFQLLTFVALLPQKLKPGSLVLLRNSARDGRKGDKFQAWYLGPYKTVGTVREERFQTAQPATDLLLIKSVNACRLKLYRNWQWPLLHQNFQVKYFLLIFF